MCTTWIEEDKDMSCAPPSIVFEGNLRLSLDLMFSRPPDHPQSIVEYVRDSKRLDVC